MGFVIPLTLGALSSATITFVYKASSFRMDETHAMMWGSGQTVVHAAFGITRILATLWDALSINATLRKGEQRFQIFQHKVQLQEIVSQNERVHILIGIWKDVDIILMVTDNRNRIIPHKGEDWTAFGLFLVMIQMRIMKIKSYLRHLSNSL